MYSCSCLVTAPAGWEAFLTVATLAAAVGVAGEQHFFAEGSVVVSQLLAAGVGEVQTGYYSMYARSAAAGGGCTQVQHHQHQHQHAHLATFAAVLADGEGRLVGLVAVVHRTGAVARCLVSVSSPPAQTRTSRVAKQPVVSKPAWPAPPEPSWQPSKETS